MEHYKLRYWICERYSVHLSYIKIKMGGIEENKSAQQKLDGIK